MKYLRFIIWVIYFILFGKIASASCLLFNENERLSNYCLLETVKGKVVDQNTAIIVSQKLKREGYFGGLKNSEWSTRFYPDFDYSDNINGGNPNKPLILGGLEFEGDPELIKQEGFIGTLNFYGSNRATFGPGRYLQANISAAYSYSPKHKNGFSNANLSSCYKHKLTSTNALDFCASASHQNKEIIEDTNKSLSLSMSKLGFDNNIGFSEGQIGIIRLISDDYIQSQLAFSWDIIHKRNLYSAISLRFGNPVELKTALNYGIDFNISRIINSRKFSLSFSHELNDGGMLFGENRSDITNKISMVSNLNENTKIKLSYISTDSSIDYFDQSYPNLKLTFNW